MVNWVTCPDCGGAVDNVTGSFINSGEQGRLYHYECIRKRWGIDTPVEDKVVYESGGSRSRDVEGVRYDLIPHTSLKRLAQRYGLGAVQHGDRNWEGGIPASATFNHIVEHLGKWSSGDRNDDHLAAAAWGCFALMYYEKEHPEVMDMPIKEGPGS